MFSKPKVGKIIIPPFLYPEKHELETPSFFANTGKDVEFLKPSNTKGSKTPDIKMEGVLWEMKSPVGKGKKTVEKQLQRAGKQSKNIIFDSRRSALGDDYIAKELHKKFILVRSIKRLLLVTKKDTVVAFKRK